MKKVLSILLAVLIIGACATIDASAASQSNVTTNESELSGQALECFRKAQAGDAVAMYELAYCFYTGNGAKRDNKMVFYWANKASENGCPGGSWLVAQCYDEGRGVTKSETKAKEWWAKVFSQAQTLANNGDVVAQSVLSKYYFRNGDDSHAVYWLSKAAEQGYGYAQYWLGECYYWSTGVTEDFSKMIYWIQKAAEQGNALSQWKLGFCYHEGFGVPKDINQSAFWLQKAAEQGYDKAQHSLGNYYFGGKGVPQDKRQGVFLIKKAAENGYAWAQYALGDMYYDGEDVDQNYSEAIKWYRKAAEQGESSALNSLGDMYRDGKGCKKNLTEACKWYKIAADLGDEEAQEKLNSLSRCSRCDGTGKVECSACDGYGETYTRPNPRESFAIKRGCRRCGGGGSKDYNAMTGEVYSDNGFYSGDGVVTCPSCHGTGQKSQTSNRNTKSNSSKRKRR